MLRAAWREALHDEPATLVLGLSSDKDVPAILRALAGPWTRVHTVQAQSPRALDRDALARMVQEAWPETPVFASPSAAAAVHSATGPILVCGSLFLVGEVMAAFAPGDLEQL
jgi:dihydrofolate synthase/folylpolyglutamate synthase